MRALVEAVRASSLPTMDHMSALNSGQSRASGFGAANVESRENSQDCTRYKFPVKGRDPPHDSGIIY